jgi:ketosteroid isomerase-like protein
MQTWAVEENAMEELIRSEIIALEKAYWKAMTEKDLEAALELTDFPALVAGAHGVYSVDKQQYAKLFKEAPEQVRSFDFDEESAQVRQLGHDTAVIAYTARSQFTRDGKEEVSDVADTSTWVRKDGKWVCAMHSETELLKH